MSFTDGDLKRFKQTIEQIHYPDVEPETLLDLLSRLEAAEMCAQGLANVVELEGLKGWPKALVAEWRKACGK